MFRAEICLSRPAIRRRTPRSGTRANGTSRRLGTSPQAPGDGNPEGERNIDPNTAGHPARRPRIPQDKNHAVWKTINPENDGCTFVVNEPNAKLTIFAEKPDNDGIVNATASNIDLNEAMAGTHNLATLFMKIDNQWTSLELPGKSGFLKLTTTQLASLFDESEPVVLKAYGW